MKIGDVLVFTGNKTGEKHYDNFEVGKSYTISNITTIGYDMDNLPSEFSICVLFKDHSHGAIRMNLVCLFFGPKPMYQAIIRKLKDVLDKYFIPIEEYRDQQINKIIQNI